MDIRFYKEDNRWYADLPEYINAGGSKDDCEMVGGADTWLDKLSGKADEITLSISDEDETMPYKLSLVKEEDFGATYLTEDSHILWLCPVTIFVFQSDYPTEIYYKIL